jgi:hypothetical protein
LIRVQASSALPADALVPRDDQPGEILGEVPPLRLVGKQVGQAFNDVAHDTRKIEKGWHGEISRGTNEPSLSRAAAGSVSAEINIVQPFGSKQHII